VKPNIAKLLKKSDIFHGNGESTFSQHIFDDVVTNDTYGLRTCNFTPDTVYDIGAHIGCFAALAREVWPTAKIVSIEPDPDNFERLSKVGELLGNIQCINAALGNAPLHFCRGTGSDSHCYQGISTKATKEWFDNRAPQHIVPSDIPCLSLCDIVSLAESPGKYVIKVDVEGGECCIYDSQEDTDAIRASTYFAFEVHIKQPEWDAPPTASRFCERYIQTHHSILYSSMMWLYAQSDSHEINIDIPHPLCWIAIGKQRPTCITI
jgi:FkbM family methyltransferase